MSKKYDNVESAIAGINLQGLPPQQVAPIQGEIRAAVRPVLATLFDADLTDTVRDQLITGFVENAIPSMVKTVVRHLGNKAA